MLEKLIAGWLNAFKQSNPKLWGTIAVILTTAQVVIEYLLSSGIIPEGAAWVEWVIWVIALSLGSGGLAAHKYRKELDAMEIEPHVASILTADKENELLKEENQRLKEIIRSA